MLRHLFGSYLSVTSILFAAASPTLNSWYVTIKLFPSTNGSMDEDYNRRVRIDYNGRYRISIVVSIIWMQPCMHVIMHSYIITVVWANICYYSIYYMLLIDTTICKQSRCAYNIVWITIDRLCYVTDENDCLMIMISNDKNTNSIQNFMYDWELNTP